MKSAEYDWVANAEDSRILDWYADGSEQAPDGATYAAMLRCVRDIHNAGSAAHSIEVLQEKKEKKDWRRGVRNPTEAKLARLDAVEMDKLDKEIASASQRVEESVKTDACKTALAAAATSI